MADTYKGGNIGEKTHEAATTARQAGQEAKQTIQQGASNVGKRAQDMASNLGSSAQDMASGAGEQADSALSSVAQGMSNLAGTLRERAPHEGMVGYAASTVAEGLESGGHYLQEHGLSDMTEDLASLIRTYPKASLGIAFGLGWLFGMSCRR
jgi:cell division septum initiation protein DivIVA